MKNQRQHDEPIGTMAQIKRLGLCQVCEQEKLLFREVVAGGGFGISIRINHWTNCGCGMIRYNA